MVHFIIPSKPCVKLQSHVLDIVEDEFNFVFHCPFYSDLRNCLIEKIQSKNPDLFWLSKVDILNWLFKIFWFSKIYMRGLAAKTEHFCLVN